MVHMLSWLSFGDWHNFLASHQLQSLLKAKILSGFHACVRQPLYSPIFLAL